MEHTLADESLNKGGLLLLKLAETMEKLPSKSPKILPSRDEGEGPAIEEHELEITEKRDTLKKESEDESKMNEEEKKIHERTMKEELRAHESDLVGIQEKKDDAKAELRKLDEGVSEDDRKELQNFLIEMACNGLIEFGEECLEMGSKAIDIMDFITAGVVGKDLWTVLLYEGTALPSFGPVKMKSFERGSKGGGRAKAKARMLRTTEDGEHLLGKMKEHLDEVMAILNQVTQMENTHHTIMGASAAVVILSGVSDRGRALLTFQFRDILGTSSMIFSRSIAEL